VFVVHDYERHDRSKVENSRIEVKGQLFISIVVHMMCMIKLIVFRFITAKSIMGTMVFQNIFTSENSFYHSDNNKSFCEQSDLM